MAGARSGEAAAEEAPAPAAIAHPGRLLGQNRQFLDFFWDIAKPEQEIRLRATEALLRHLRENQANEDLLKYTQKRLIDGLGATREAARPGFTLALAQVLQSFETIPLFTVLEQFTEKYDLARVKKKLFRNALFGNFFGVLALFQSGRLAKDAKTLLQCVQLLQCLSEHHVHLKDLPRKTLADIVSEIPETVFEEVLFSILEEDLTSAFSTPGQLYLLLVGVQKFPRVLRPEKLKVLLGSPAVVSAKSIPRLVEVLKMAAKSEKKDKALPTVGLDLMKVALKEGTFELFWNEAIEKELVQDKSGPCSYMCFRLLGSALPLLSLRQLKAVLRGEVMRQYGIHVVSNKLPGRFQFAPEMDAYVGSFLAGCGDAQRQLAVVAGFCSLTNRGSPVVPTFWKAVRHLLPSALLQHVDWLKNMFLNPDLDRCLDFATKRQQENEKKHDELAGHCITRLRKWIIAHLVGIVENPQITREEQFIMDIIRFGFFHAFFETKKPLPKIAETNASPSVPLSEASRAAAADSFFSLLQHVNAMPALGSSERAEEMRKKHQHGLTACGDPWIYLAVQYANVLLSHPEHVKAVAPFSEEEQFAWDRMLQTVEALRRREQKSPHLKTSAFQQLLLLVGVHLFKSPAECVNLLNDLQNCTKRAFGEKRKKKPTATAGGEEEPDWLEVIVEVLLSLLAQSSVLIRRVCKSVFGLVSQHMTQGALQLILDVLDPRQDQDEEGAVVVMEETQKKHKPLPRDVSTDNAGSESSSGEDSSDENDSESDTQETESEAEETEADENFRAMLRNVLQAGNAQDGGDSDEDADDETMMSLDKNLSALFAEQQKRIQAKKDEKEKLRKEKILRRDFKIKVLDLVEVFLTKRAESPLVFSVIDPLLTVIEQSMSSESNKQEQDYLRKTAAIFTNNLCRSKQYCKNVAPIREELHTQLEDLVKRACKQSDSSVALYCFSASLYLVRVLKGNAGAGEAAPHDAQPKTELSGGRGGTAAQHPAVGSLDLERVAAAYREALHSFLSKRKSPLTGSMFLDLFERHPVICKQLIDTVLKSITDGARQHQQTQACLLLQKALQSRDFLLLLSDKEREELTRESIHQVAKTLKAVGEFKVKVDQEKVIKGLELLNYLIRTVSKQELSVDLAQVRGVLQGLGQHETFGKSKRLDDLYWHVMKLLGVTRPAKQKAVAQPKEEVEAEPPKRKKKGFLPATKKRKNRKTLVPGQPQEAQLESGGKGGPASVAAAAPAGKTRKRKRKKEGRAGAGGKSHAPEEGPPAKKPTRPLGRTGAADGQQGKRKRRKKGKKAKASSATSGAD